MTPPTPSTASPAIFLKEDRSKPVVQRHPWVFSGAIDAVEGELAPGDIVDIHDAAGKFLATGYWNERSQIQARILTWKHETIDDAWWQQQMRRAIESRGAWQVGAATDACRLINAESDYLPGLVVDRYGDWLVMQALTLGIDRRKDMLATLLMEITGARGIYERSDVDVRSKEGLKSATGVLVGDEAPAQIVIHEDGVQMEVDVHHGHKTGFYLDQRANRRLLRDLVGRTGGDPRILNLFSYTCAFGLHALHAGARRLVNVDASKEVLAAGERNLALNGFPADGVDHVAGDVFDVIRRMHADEEKFDIIVCDPPKFAHTAAQVDSAARGYKDLNLHAFRLLQPGGYLLTFSCSGAITRDLFQKIVFGALADSGRHGQIIRHLGPDEDHPVALTFPEGEYLKGLLVRVW